MTATKALTIEGKDPKVLEKIPLHDGQRVFADTVLIALCRLPMRRSFRFDSSDVLHAIGLTYKTTPDNIQTALRCAYNWLLQLYGKPTKTLLRKGVKQTVWEFRSHTQLTLEARGYNPHDYFVLIYYYQAGTGKDA